MIGQLFGSAFLSICMGLSGSYNEACMKALDATTRQLGIRQKAEFVENRVNVVLNEQVVRRVPHKSMVMIGLVGFGYKTVKERKVGFKIPTFGVCSSARGEVSLNGDLSLNLNWNF